MHSTFNNRVHVHILVESCCTSVETSIGVANSTSKLKNFNKNYEGLGTCEAVRSTSVSNYTIIIIGVCNSIRTLCNCLFIH